MRVQRRLGLALARFADRIGNLVSALDWMRDADRGPR
jgi:hypothetical protein